MLFKCSCGVKKCDIQELCLKCKAFQKNDKVGEIMGIYYGKNKIASIKSQIITLIDSCNEGIDGTWDCSTDEGKGGFKDMISILKNIDKILDKIKGIL